MNLIFLSHDKTLFSQTAASDTAERQIAYAKILVKKRPDSHLHLLVRTDTANDPIQQLSPHVTIYAVGQSLHKFIRNTAKIAKQIAQNTGIDMVSSQSPFSDGIIALWISRKFKAKLFVQLHMSSLDNTSWLAENATNQIRTWFAHIVMKRATAVRVTNPSIKKWLVTKWQLPANRICINAVGHINLTPDPDIQRSQNPSLLYVGRLSSEKGVALLLESFAAVIDELPTATLTIVGDGPQKEDLIYLSNQLNLKKQVTFAGSLPPEELPAYYQNAWLFVLPSHHESFGRVILEAYSLHLPVLATATEGAKLLVKTGETGFLVPIADKDALSQQIITALKQPDVLAKIGNSAYAFVQDEYTVEKMRQAFVTMWINIVEMNRCNSIEAPL